ncbi:MAG: SpoIID/LytB domain-containing protein [Candidatus Methanoperedens sp.]
MKKKMTNCRSEIVKSIYVTAYILMTAILIFAAINIVTATSSAAATSTSTITTEEFLAKIQPYLIPENRVNPNTPLCKSFGGACDIYVYKIPGTNPAALVVTASAAVDCDGIRTTTCNENTDDGYQYGTSFETSTGQPLDASTLPWYVLPDHGNYFNYANNGIRGGQLGLVMYGDKQNYGIFGDENANTRKIGEVSYAMAKSLGINPDPSNGGAASGVWYIIFTGSGNVVSPIEDHSKAVTMGNTAMNTLLNQLGNSTPTATPSPTPTVTSTPAPTATPSPTPTVTSTPAPTATPSLTPSVASTPAPTATTTPTPAPGDTIRVYRHASGKIEVLNIETQYLPYVVAAENRNAPFESMKAQAVAARAFAYYRKEHPRSASYDIYDDTRDQVYRTDITLKDNHTKSVSNTNGIVARWSNILFHTFYVSGSDSYAQYVTYNEGKSGNNITQTTLGWVSNPPSLNPYNRGAMGQIQANALASNNGYTYDRILRYFYGTDIIIELYQLRTPAPTATPSPTPAVTSTPAPTATPSPTPTVTSTPAPTATPSPTLAPGDTIRVYRHASGKIEVLNMETQYLPYVVAAENGNAPFESMKAQAVAARTFAYYRKGHPRSASYDIYDDSRDQNYRTDITLKDNHRKSVSDTNGFVARWNSILFVTFYVSGSDSYAKYVTYNEGKSGNNITQTTLGWVTNPPSLNPYNRGAMGQIQANALASNKGYTYDRILRYFYGADIIIKSK